MKDDPQNKFLEEVQLLTEMAGISTKISGLTYKLWIGYHGMSNHFHPYVKVMDNKIALASVSINEPIKILVGDSNIFDRKSWEKIVEFITINREVLLNFYQHGAENDFDEYEDFTKKLKRVS